MAEANVSPDAACSGSLRLSVSLDEPYSVFINGVQVGTHHSQDEAMAHSIRLREAGRAAVQKVFDAAKKASEVPA